MAATPDGTLKIQATVATVMPSLGLAFVTDGAHDWGVTRSALGERFEELMPGLRVQLALQHHRNATLVAECETIPSHP